MKRTKKVKEKRDQLIGRYIKIRICETMNPSYDNIIPNTIHKVVEAPEGGKNGGIEGIWVQGIGEKVNINMREYYMIEKNKMKRTKSRK